VFPGKPETSHCVAPIRSEPPDGITASLRSTGVRTNSLPRVKRGYVGDICWETMPSRTKPEGWIPDTPGSVLTLHFLLLTRPVRCREGQTADDAVLTLIFLISANFKPARPSLNSGGALGTGESLS
jgi:hypothetical protein